MCFDHFLIPLELAKWHSQSVFRDDRIPQRPGMFAFKTVFITQIGTGSVSSRSDMYKFFMSLPNVFDKRHPAVFSGTVHINNLLEPSLSNAVDQLGWISSMLKSLI